MDHVPVSLSELPQGMAGYGVSCGIGELNLWFQHVSRASTSQLKCYAWISGMA